MWGLGFCQERLEPPTSSQGPRGTWCLVLKLRLSKPGPRTHLHHMEMLDMAIPAPH